MNPLRAKSIAITGWDDFPPYAFLDDWVIQFGMRISAERPPEQYRCQRRLSWRRHARVGLA